MFSKREGILVSKLGAETHGPDRGQENEKSTVPTAGRKTKNPRSRPRAGKRKIHGPGRGQKNEKSTARSRARKQDPRSPAAGGH